MASSNYIQKIFAADEVAGSVDLGEGSTQDSNRNQVEIFLASEAITAGALVSLDLSQTTNGEKLFIIAEADATDACPVGVAVSAIAANAKGEVVIKGIVEEALTNGSATPIVVGDALTFSADGKLVKKAAANEPECAVALEAQAADGTSRVYVLKRF
jgi:hypothetical protein